MNIFKRYLSIYLSNSIYLSIYIHVLSIILYNLSVHLLSAVLPSLLPQALVLDYQGIHKEQFVYFRHCVNLKSQLFQSPDDKLDKAISIIEQVIHKWESFFFLSASIYLPIYICIYLSIYLSNYLSIYLYTIYLSNYLFLSHSYHISLNPPLIYVLMVFILFLYLLVSY